jgi:hypothetical protein
MTTVANRHDSSARRRGVATATEDIETPDGDTPAQRARQGAGEQIDGSRCDAMRGASPWRERNRSAGVVSRELRALRRPGRCIGRRGAGLKAHL